MPLKLVRRSGSDFWYVRGTVQRQSVFESTGTTRQEEAEGYLEKRQAELYKRAVHGTRAVVTFAEAVTSYIEKEERTPTTIRAVGLLLEHFRTTHLSRINQEALDAAYRALLTKGIEASAATKVRHVLTPLRAILEHAAVRGWCDRPAFETPKIPRTRTSFLRPAEATALVANAAPHVAPLLVFLIGTGARMSEALELEWSSVDLRGARAVVWQKQDTERHIDLPPVVVAALDAIEHREGRVFRPLRSRKPKGAAKGKTVGDGYSDTGRSGGGQIKAAWSFACRRAGLAGSYREWVPKGQTKQKRWFVPDVTPHDCRHTWATWHYCLHRDLLRLKEDGGWETIAMVTRYAKKMPDAYRPEIAAWLNGSVPAHIPAKAGQRTDIATCTEVQNPSIQRKQARIL